MEWVDRLAAELSLDVLSPHEKDVIDEAVTAVRRRLESRGAP